VIVPTGNSVVAMERVLTIDVNVMVNMIAQMDLMNLVVVS